MSRYQFQVKNGLRDGAAGCNAREMKRCPHCGELLEAEPEVERIRWYIADTGTPRRVSTMGEKLIDSLRTNGQAVYVSEDGRQMRRVGIAIASAAGEDHTPTEEREPIILTPAEFARYWRPAGRPVPGAPRTMRAGGGR